MGMQNFWARLVSAIFHPLLLPAMAMALLFAIPSYVSFSISTSGQRLIILIIFINTCVAPMLSIVFLKRMGLISSVLLDDRKDRIYPVMVSMIFYLFTWYLFRQANLPSLVQYFVIGATLLVLIGFAVTFYWKISIHMISMGGFTGFLISLSLLLKYDMPGLIISTILISGLLGSARIKLNAHNPPQVYAGYLTGVFVMLLLFLWLRG
ncbi:MAG: hypothetical protein ACK4VN_03500 [Bacteroidales bacterium]